MAQAAPIFQLRVRNQAGNEDNQINVYDGDTCNAFIQRYINEVHNGRFGNVPELTFNGTRILGDGTLASMGITANAQNKLVYSH